MTVPQWPTFDGTGLQGWNETSRLLPARAGLARLARFKRSGTAGGTRLPPREQPTSRHASDASYRRAVCAAKPCRGDTDPQAPPPHNTRDDITGTCFQKYSNALRLFSLCSRIFSPCIKDQANVHIKITAGIADISLIDQQKKSLRVCS